MSEEKTTQLPEEFKAEVKAIFDGFKQEIAGKASRDYIDQKLATVEATLKAAADEYGVKANQRIDQLETRMKAPAGGADEAKAAEKKYEAAYDTFLRKNQYPDAETKALVAQDDATGGYLRVPAMRDQQILQDIKEFSPIRELADVRSGMAFAYEQVRRTGAHAITSVTETGTRAETTTPSYELVRIETHEFYAWPAATTRMLADGAINIEQEINDSLALDFMDQVAAHYVNGDGVQEPQGFTTDANITSVNSGSAAAITIAGMITLALTPKEGYRNSPSAAFAMNRNTLISLFKLSDGVSRPYLLPDLSRPGSMAFMGKPIREFPDLPDEGAGAYPVYFGDWKRGYRIYDRQGFYQLRDPFTSTTGYIIFKTSWRTGGKVWVAEALKKLKCQA